MGRAKRNPSNPVPIFQIRAQHAPGVPRAFKSINQVGTVKDGFRFALPILRLLEWPQVAAHVQQTDNLHVGLIAGGFMLAALAKFGQFPFVGWLPRALEGPTPSSAIFYGSLMVHAGVYLLLRLEPLLMEAPVIMGPPA
ncbi:hypothetical protein CCP3SC1_420018 [Gammaproteobacteria bacterium]